MNSNESSQKPTLTEIMKNKFASFIKWLSYHWPDVMALGLVFSFVFWLFFLNHISTTEVGVAVNHRTGVQYTLKRGWNLSPPWTTVCSFDTDLKKLLITERNDLEPIRSILVRFRAEQAVNYVNTYGMTWNSTPVIIMQEYNRFGNKSPFIEVVKE